MLAATREFYGATMAAGGEGPACRGQSRAEEERQAPQNLNGLQERYGRTG
eukprot:SAG25_NODE_12990_length_273_cov_0.551724_1_plen_49_part_01